ncbi:MAG: ABC transporter substrate-binding protein [Rhodobacteraceae bacterium]|nr:ABC transporter substrate-binding protein [Paracoccaceae bacterium]
MKNLLASAAVLAALVTGASAEPTLLTEGELRILTNPIYPPIEYVNPDSGTLDGLDIDLANAIAGKLGLQTVFVASSFESLLSGLETGRGDMIMSGMSDNVKRQESVDFVDYLTSGPILFTTTANGASYHATKDFCGKIIAGSRSTSFGDNVNAWSDANCVANGLPAITFEGTEDSNAARLGLRQGRYDGVVQGIETIAWQMRVEPDTYVMVGEPLLSNDVFGMAFSKANPDLRDGVAKALDELIASGEYAEILAKWGLDHNAVEKAVVNGVK